MKLCPAIVKLANKLNGARSYPVWNSNASSSFIREAPKFPHAHVYSEVDFVGIDRMVKRMSVVLQAAPAHEYMMGKTSTMGIFLLKSCSAS
jgi:hypothetical protein